MVKLEKKDKITYKGTTYNSLIELYTALGNKLPNEDERVTLEVSMKSISRNVEEVAHNRAYDIVKEINDKVENEVFKKWKEYRD